MPRRIDRRDEANIPTELEKEEKRTRVPSKDAIENWSEGTEQKTSERTARSDGQRSVAHQP